MSDVERLRSCLRKGDMVTPFHMWNASEQGMTEDESRDRMAMAEAQCGGFGSREFKKRILESMSLFLMFGRSRAAAYRHGWPLHFARFLSYQGDVRDGESWLATAVSGADDQVRILDFGCGLARTSLQAAVMLCESGRKPSLFLVDVPTPRKDFLRWACDGARLPMTWLDSDDSPRRLPSCDAVVAVDVLEHLEEPMGFVEAIDEALVGGGVLMATLKRYKVNSEHVTESLSHVKGTLYRRGYVQIAPDAYRKPDDGRKAKRRAAR